MKAENNSRFEIWSTFEKRLRRNAQMLAKKSFNRNSDDTKFDNIRSGIKIPSLPVREPTYPEVCRRPNP